MSFKTLQERFGNLEALYHECEKSILEANEGTVGYAGFDFFSLEHFNLEFNNIPKEKIAFYRTPEEVPNQDEIYLVVINNSKILSARQYYGQDIFYDSVFIHTDQESWHYHIYMNGTTFKPIFVEHLTRSQHGTPQTYEKYDTHGYGYQHTTYHWEDTEEHPCHIETAYYSEEDKPRYATHYHVYYQEDEVSRIVDAEGKDVYNLENQRKGIEYIIDEVKQNIITAVQQTLEEKHHLFKGTIAFALFEYTLQGPFPPTLALATQEEAEAEEDPFLPYNAPDIEYFSENDEYEFDFYHRGRDLYDVLNRHIDDMDSDDAIELSRSIYISLCHSPELLAIFQEYLTVDEDFHITVYDFDACDLDEMLPLTIREEIWNKLSQKKQAYEDNKSIPEQYLEPIHEMLEAMKMPAAQWETLRRAAQAQATTFGYLPKKQYFIQPNEYERRFQEPAPYANFLQRTGAVDTLDDEHTFKHYLDQQGRVCFIEGYHKGAVGCEFIFTYEPDKITEYRKYEGREVLDTKGTLYLQDGQPQRGIRYEAGRRIQQTQYTFENGILTQSQDRMLTFDIEEKFCIENNYVHRYTYAESGMLVTVGCYSLTGEEIVTYEVQGEG